MLWAPEMEMVEGSILPACVISTASLWSPAASPLPLVSSRSSHSVPAERFGKLQAYKVQTLNLLVMPLGEITAPPYTILAYEPVEPDEVLGSFILVICVFSLVGNKAPCWVSPQGASAGTVNANLVAEVWSLWWNVNEKKKTCHEKEKLQDFLKHCKNIWLLNSLGKKAKSRKQTFFSLHWVTFQYKWTNLDKEENGFFFSWRMIVLLDFCFVAFVLITHQCPEHRKLRAYNHLFLRGDIIK